MHCDTNANRLATAVGIDSGAMHHSGRAHSGSMHSGWAQRNSTRRAPQRVRSPPLLGVGLSHIWTSPLLGESPFGQVTSGTMAITTHRCVDDTHFYAQQTQRFRPVSQAWAHLHHQPYPDLLPRTTSDRGRPSTPGASDFNPLLAHIQPGANLDLCSLRGRSPSSRCATSDTPQLPWESGVPRSHRSVGNHRPHEDNHEQRLTRGNS